MQAICLPDKPLTTGGAPMDEPAHGDVHGGREVAATRGHACSVQNGLPLTLASAGAPPSRPADVGVWAALGAVLVVSTLYSFSGQGLIWGLVWACSAVFAYGAFVHLAERRRCDELRGGWRALGEGVVGLAWGAFMSVADPLMTAAVVPGAVLQVAHVSGLMATATFVYALCEELIWRGLLLRFLEPRIGSGLALAATAIGFAVWHLTSSPYYLIDLAAAGALFGAAYLCTRRLWMSIGLHTGWNLAVDALATRDGMTTLLSFGAVLLLHVFATTVLLVVAQRRGRLVGSRWRWRRPRASIAAAPAPGVPAPEVPLGAASTPRGALEARVSAVSSIRVDLTRPKADTDCGRGPHVSPAVSPSPQRAKTRPILIACGIGCSVLAFAALAGVVLVTAVAVLGGPGFFAFAVGSDLSEQREAIQGVDIDTETKRRILGDLEDVRRSLSEGNEFGLFEWIEIDESIRGVLADGRIDPGELDSLEGEIALMKSIQGVPAD